MDRLSYSEWDKFACDKQMLQHHYLSTGGFWVENLDGGFDEFESIVDSITVRYVNDAVRRKERFGRKEARDVDSGTQEIYLHSESSFSPICPQTISFYCVSSDSAIKSPTTICDGIQVWKRMSLTAKDFFLKNPIEYHLSIELPKRLKTDTWFIDRVGCGEAVVKDGKYLSFISRRFAVNELVLDEGQIALSFANHLLVPLESESQLTARSYAGGKRIPRDLEEEFISICAEETREINWETGDMLMLNNHRYMHGRRPIPPNTKRDIVIMQSELVQFL